MQIVMPGGGITTIDEHEVNSFPDRTGIVQPPLPVVDDDSDVSAVLETDKLDESVGSQ